MDTFIKDTLKKQMQILSERSVRENGEYLAPITEQMIKLAIILEPEIQSELFPVVPLPLSERLTIADMEALVIGKRERERQRVAEAQQSWNNLREQLIQQQEENLQNQPK